MGITGAEHPSRHHLDVPHEGLGVGIRNLDMTNRLDARADRSRRAKHDDRAYQREVRQRRMDRLETLLLDTLADHTAHSGEDSGDEAELIGSEMRAAIRDLPEEDWQEVRRLVDRADKRGDDAIELLRGGAGLLRRLVHAIGDGHEYIAHDAVVQGPLV